MLKSFLLCLSTLFIFQTAQANLLEAPPLIIGDLEWYDIRELDSQDPIREQSSFVAFLSFRRLILGSRCTGFMVSEDVIMTNYHCIKGQFRARRLDAAFRFETGTAPGNYQVHECREFLGGNKDLDYSLIRCSGSPGRRLGWAQLGELTLNYPGRSIYIVQQNCDFHNDKDCAPTKKVSFGSLNDARGAEITHNADTLGGSSGSPIFDQDTHELIGIHYAGRGNLGNGRGLENVGMSIEVIYRDMRARFPHLRLFPAR